MTIKEFWNEVRDSYLEYLSFYHIQKDSYGQKYINTPIETKESLIERLELEETPDDIEEFDDEECEVLMEKVKAEIIAEYDNVLLIRKKFWERMNPGEKYEEEFAELDDEEPVENPGDEDPIDI